MSIVPQFFLPLAHEKFDYLRDDFGFSASDQIGEGWVQSVAVLFDSPKVAITPSWNSRDGIAIGIGAKEDTFWIRPASSHGFDVQELIQIVAPEALKRVPSFRWPDETRSDLEAWLGFYAGQLREHAPSLLRGDLSLCEDMLIMRYCNSTKGLPSEEYFKIFREESRTLSAEDQRELEAAIASGSPRQLCFLLDEWVHAGRLRGERMLTTLHDFWLQYLQ
jgi:hypothetical protein